MLRRLAAATASSDTHDSLEVTLCTFLGLDHDIHLKVVNISSKNKSNKQSNSDNNNTDNYKHILGLDHDLVSRQRQLLQTVLDVVGDLEDCQSINMYVYIYIYIYTHVYKYAYMYTYSIWICVYIQYINIRRSELCGCFLWPWSDKCSLDVS